MPHTLLLADDSVTIQRVIELTFADEDVDVVAVSDGDQAIARLESAPPDIVLADIGMPGRNGYEVARYVKQSPKLSHIPVVLLTGAFEPVDQARAIEVGCDGVLAKPFEPQLVIGRVKELLTSEARKSEPPGAPSATAVAAPAPPVSAPPAPVQPAPEAADLDDYFDRLDVAFAKLSTQPVGRASTPTDVDTRPPQPSAAPSLSDQIDWFAQRSADASTDIPLSYASPASAFENPVSAEPAAAPPAAVASVPAPETPAPAASITPVPEPLPSTPLPATVPVAAVAPLTAPPPTAQPATAPPSIAEAFAAILAAEREESLPEGHPQWPASFAPPAPVDVTDEVIDRIVQRVLDRMSDRVVRETVHETVADVAERLVREEIDRIKSALK